MSTLHEASSRPCTPDDGERTLSGILHRLEGLKRRVRFCQHSPTVRLRTLHALAFHQEMKHTVLATL